MLCCMQARPGQAGMEAGRGGGSATCLPGVARCGPAVDDGHIDCNGQDKTGMCMCTAARPPVTCQPTAYPLHIIAAAAAATRCPARHAVAPRALPTNPPCCAPRLAPFPPPRDLFALCGPVRAVVDGSNPGLIHIDAASIYSAMGPGPGGRPPAEAASAAAAPRGVSSPPATELLSGAGAAPGAGGVGGASSSGGGGLSGAGSGPATPSGASGEQRPDPSTPRYA